MFEMGWYSVKLFLKGKLIREPMQFWRQIAIGTGIGSLLFVSLTAIKFPLWLPVAVSSLVTGAFMPFLLKDFKMK